MSQSKFTNFGTTLGLKVSSVEVQKINPIIFATKVNTGSFGNVVDNDGVPTLIDVVANTAEPLTPATVVDAAKTGFIADKPSVFQATAIATSEAFGAVTEITFVKAGGTTLGIQSIKAFTKDNGMKVTDIEIAVQNDVIFSTKGIPSMSGLTEKDEKFYAIDIVANTATVVNAEALSTQAKEDILAGKETEATRFVTSFGLITSMTLAKPAA